jgi:hypothetical protein
MQTHVNRQWTNCLGGKPNAVESLLLGRCIAQGCRKMLNLTAHMHRQRATQSTQTGTNCDAPDQRAPSSKYADAYNWTKKALPSVDAPQLET